MEAKLKHIDPVTTRTDCLVVGVHAGGKFSATVQRIDDASGGMLTRLARSGDLKGNIKQTLLIHEPYGLRAGRLLLVGLGESGKPLTTTLANRALTAAANAVKTLPLKDLTVLLDDFQIASADGAWAVREWVKILDEYSYRFDGYKSRKDNGNAPPGPPARLVLGRSERKPLREEESAIGEARALCAGRRLVRDLGNQPPNVCHPEYLAGRARELARASGRKLKVSVLDEQKIQTLGMGAFLSVAQGSEQPGRIIALEYAGGRAKDQPYVFVGKGITFDTGGISIKPGAGLDEMKYDMCGAATVFGLMHAVAELALPLNVVGVVAAAENMPSGRASRPGDIVKTLSGQTVEILNTDAEGRLVLCDILTWIAKYRPKAVIDIATLTGACVVALGNQAHGLYANDESLAEGLLTAGREANDRGWRMPLWDEYQEQLDSPFADMANIGGPKAGSVTAACFLSRFTRDYAWAHLDIAGTAWHSHAPYKGATGRPLAMLLRYLVSVCGKR